MPSTPTTYLRLGLIALVVLTLLYGVLVAEILLAFLLALLGVFLYLFWRLVVAHERLAAAMDDGGGAATADTSTEDDDPPTTADPPIEEP